MEVINAVLSESVPINDASSNSANISGLENSGDTFSNALEEMISKLTNGLGNTGKLLVETSATVIPNPANGSGEASLVARLNEEVGQGWTGISEIAVPVQTSDDEVVIPAPNVILTLSGVEGEESHKRITENHQPEVDGPLAQNKRLDSIDNIGKSIGQQSPPKADQPMAEIVKSRTPSVVLSTSEESRDSSAVLRFTELPHDDNMNSDQKYSSTPGVEQLAGQPVVEGVNSQLTTGDQNKRLDSIDNIGKSVGQQSPPEAPARPSGGNQSMAEGVRSYSPNVILSPQGEESLDTSLRSRMTPLDPSVVLHSAGLPQDDNVSSAPGVERIAVQPMAEGARNQQVTVNYLTNMGSDRLNSPLVSAKDLVSQIVQHIVISVSKDKSNARIQLKPEFLGELKVKIEFSNNQLTAKFEAANSMTKELLEASAFKIKQVLEAHGLKVDEFVVQLKDGQHRHHGQGSFTDDGRDRQYGDGNSMRYSDEKEEKVKNYYLDGLNEWVA